MSFIESIRKYQSDGDRVIIDRVREDMNTDFLSYKERGGTTAFERPELFIAFRILRMIGGRLSTIKYRLTEEEWVDPAEELIRYEIIIRQYADVELNPDDNFKDLVENAQDVRGILGEVGYYGLLNVIDSLLNGNNRRDELVQAEINALYLPLILPALEYALSKVDTARSEREIVRYVNKALLTEYYRLQIEREGLRRVRRQGDDGEVTTRYVKPHSGAGVDYAILGAGCVSFDYDAMSKRRRLLYDSMREIVSADFIAGSFGEYHVDTRGNYRVKNRYIANRLGLHEVSISRALKVFRSYMS